MEVDDDVRAMIGQEVRAAALRNPMPDPDEVLTIRCPSCEKKRSRTRREIECDTRRQGFWACSKACRKAEIARDHPVLAPMRHVAQTTIQTQEPDK